MRMQKFIFWLNEKQLHIFWSVLLLDVCLPFTHTGVKHDFHITWCSCRLKVARRVPLVEQKVLTLPEHLTLSLVIDGFCVVFRRSFCLFSFAHCIVCPFSIYGVWLHLWYLQTFLVQGKTWPVQLMHFLLNKRVLSPDIASTCDHLTLKQYIQRSRLKH